MFEVTRIDWATPPDLFAEFDREFGFTLDVCASAENAKVPRYFSIEADGLRQTWAPERCWMNPPYGREIARWVAPERIPLGGMTIASTRRCDSSAVVSGSAGPGQPRSPRP